MSEYLQDVIHICDQYILLEFTECKIRRFGFQVILNIKYLISSVLSEAPNVSYSIYISRRLREHYIHVGEMVFKTPMEEWLCMIE